MIFEGSTRYIFGNLQENQVYYLIVYTIPGATGTLQSISGATYTLMGQVSVDNSSAYLYKVSTTADSIRLTFLNANVPCVMFGQGLNLSVISNTTSASSTYNVTVGKTYYLIDNTIPGTTGGLTGITGATYSEMSTLTVGGQRCYMRLRKLVATANTIVCTWYSSVPHMLLG